MRRTASIIALSVLSMASYASGGGDAERTCGLEDHVTLLSSDSLGGRLAGSSGEKMAAEYMYTGLEAMGVTMLTPVTGQDFAVIQNGDTVYSRNIIGMVEGCDSLLRNQYIVVGANLDHLGTNVMTVDGKAVSQVFPGADDNASGIACVMEVARRVASSRFLFRRSVIFAGFGAGELGRAGSWYFVNRTSVSPDSVSVMVDVRMVGQSGQINPFTYYTGVSNPEINSLVSGLADVGAFYTPVQGDGVLPYGDYLPFYEENVPVMLLTTGPDRNARTVRDKADLLDYATMDYICDFIYNFVREAANRDQMIDRPEILSGEPAAPAQTSGERVYSSFEVDTPPEYFKGDVMTFLNEWVYTYLRYPDIPLSQGISGTVTVEFIVEKDGSVTNVRAVSGVDQYLEDEAVRVISASPKWKPGVLGGEKVRVRYSVPVEFRLKKRK